MHEKFCKSTKIFCAAGKKSALRGRRTENPQSKGGKAWLFVPLHKGEKGGWMWRNKWKHTKSHTLHLDRRRRKW